QPTFAVVLDDRVIGTVNFEVDGRIAMIGYAFARAHWGQGLATEAAAAAMQWAIAEHRLSEGWASTAVGNARSRRVMEKLGMTRDGDNGREVRYRRVVGL